MDENSIPRLIENHLLQDSTHVFAGRHMIFDVFGSPYCSDQHYVEAAMKSAVTAVGATILYSHFHDFGVGCGFTGVLILSESHASVHTWPEVDLMTFDIYMCGKCDPHPAMMQLIENLQARDFKITLLKRGIIKSHQLS